MRFLLTLFVLLGITSCTKFGKNVTVKGRLVNPITGKGIPDIRVYMYKATASLPADYKTVKEVNTGSDGAFELNKLGLSKYYVKCDVPGNYYMIGWEKKEGISLFDKFTLSVKKGKTMNADYYVVPYGYWKHTIKNTSCFNQFDTLVLNIRYQISLIYQIITPFIQVVLSMSVQSIQNVQWVGIISVVIIKRIM